LDAPGNNFTSNSKNFEFDLSVNFSKIYEKSRIIGPSPIQIKYFFSLLRIPAEKGKFSKSQTPSKILDSVFIMLAMLNHKNPRKSPKK
jgi:hypothetical protein